MTWCFLSALHGWSLLYCLLPHSVRPEEPEGADGTGSSAADGAKADEENGLPDVPPLELPKVKAPPMDVDTEVNGLAPREVPATCNTAAVTSDKVVNGC